MRSRKNKRPIFFNKYLNLLSLFFVIIILGLPLIGFFLPDQSFSAEENRVLAQNPRFSVEAFFQGRYTKKVEKYVGDQILGRNSWIYTKTYMDRLMGKKTSNGVYLCSDKSLIEDFVPQGSEDINKKQEAINHFLDKNPEVNHYFMIVPTAITINKDLLPKNSPVKSQTEVIESFVKTLNPQIKVLNPIKTLETNKDQTLYYKTDHHWTTLGAWLSFQEVAPDLSIKSDPNAYDVYPVTKDFVGALSSKSGYSLNSTDIIEVYTPKSDKDYSVVTYVDEQKKSPSLYAIQHLYEKDKYALFLDGNHPLVNIKNPVDNGRNLLIIKDSYANAFVPFLTPHFSEITLIDPRYYYNDINELMINSKITDVLYLYNANTFFQDNTLAPVLNDE
ncbi:MAG: DHHW family protein [Eubacteriaceae bacterium]